MAIIIANDGDKIVATFGAMNALVSKFDGMEVTVLDAIGDILVGGGEAGYIWSSAKNMWMLTWKTNKDNLIFRTETKTLSGGTVTSDFQPQSSLVWNCFILDAEGHTLADVTPSVTGAVVDIGSLAFDGNTLTYTYGYGAIQAAVQIELGSMQAALDAILGV